MSNSNIGSLIEIARALEVDPNIIGTNDPQLIQQAIDLVGNTASTPEYATGTNQLSQNILGGGVQDISISSTGSITTDMPLTEVTGTPVTQVEERMIPEPNIPGDISIPAEYNVDINHVYDNTIIIPAPPISRITAPVETVDPSIPGTLKVDKSGKLQKTFYVYDGLAGNNLRTYDHFIAKRIPEILASRTLKINGWTNFQTGKDEELYINFVNPIMRPPGVLTANTEFDRIFPQSAINNNMDYSSYLWATAYVRTRTGQVIASPKVYLGAIPVMVRSSLCNTNGMSDDQLIRKAFDPKDPGGYFIAGGSEKVLLIQEKLRVNQMSTYAADNLGNIITKMTCSTIWGTSIVELRYDDKTGIIKFKYGGPDPKIDVINALLPFKLLGKLVNNGEYLSVDNIWYFISSFIDPKDVRKVWRKLQNTFADLAKIRDDQVVETLAIHKGYKNLQQWEKLKTQVEREGGELADEIEGLDDEQAIQGQITGALTRTFPSGRGSRKKKILGVSKLAELSAAVKENLLQKDMTRVLFPQLDNSDNKEINKLWMLGMMLARFGEVLAGIRPMDDRDDWGNKRLESPGRMIEQLFTSIWNSMANKLQDNINQSKSISSKASIESVVKNIDHQMMTKTFYKSFTTVRWGLRKTDNSNVTDILKRASLAEAASYLTKISTPTAKEVKKPEVRMVQGSQLGYVCPIDTPEGAACLTLDSQILTGDGYTTVPISAIENGDKQVMSFNKDTYDFVSGNTDNYFAYEAKDRNKKLYKITTISGRSIKATEDHPFWTPKGWVYVRDLKVNDLLFTKHHTSYLEHNSGDNIIVSSELIIDKLNTLSISKNRINKFIKDLNNADMLPLKANDNRLPILARLAGYVFADNHVIFDLKRDAEEYKKDVSTLGIGEVKIIKSKLGWCIKNIDNLYLLFCILIREKDMLPNWISNGSLSVKREFISGLQGSNSGKINKNFSLRNTVMSTISDECLKTIVEIFKELDIQVERYGQHMKYDTKYIKFNTNETNTVKYLENVGYRYSHKRNNDGSRVYEYLKYKFLNKDNKNLMTINEFYKKYPAIGDTFSVPIGNIQEIESEIVADFRVANTNESFVANGIVVHNCGLVKHLAITCRLSIERGENLVRKELKTHNKIFNTKTETIDTVCLINGIILGWCNGIDAYKFLVEKRRNRTIFEDTCIYYNSRFKEMSIFTNAGRPIRPLLVVDNSETENPQLVIQKKNLWDADFATLLNEGAVEYIDALEQGQESVVISMDINTFNKTLNEVNKVRTDLNNALALQHLINQNNDGLIDALNNNENYGEYFDTYDEWKKYADKEVRVTQSVLDNLITSSKYTHCELDPTALMGISASLIPLANHNQGPRNIYQSSMGKQALGLVHGAISHKMDNIKSLAFPTRPFFATQSSKWLGMDEVPAGQTVSIAFMSYTGYNQEDAILINGGALQRGAFRYTVYHTYKAINKAGEFFRKIKPGIGESEKLYAALNSNGVPQIGRKVRENDYIIGRVREVELENGTKKTENISTPLPVGIEGVVDRVVISVYNGNQIMKVRIRQTRIPIRGDKFASRHAQKSTVGLVIPEEDMPSTLDGRKPVIIINPLCIPSRMTLGMVLELIGSKAAVMLGERINATAFRNFVQKGGMLEELQRVLREYGFNSLGYETMQSGITGEVFDTPIYYGPVYYQLLKHLVQFKYHARGGTGAISILTRQAVPGRTKGGGLRVGEMERDAFIGHGSAALLKGRLCDQSDAFTTVFCQKCGIPATRRITDSNVAKCSNCNSDQDIGVATIPYAYQLLTHLLRGVGLRPTFNMVRKESPNDLSTIINDTQE